MAEYRKPVDEGASTAEIALGGGRADRRASEAEQAAQIAEAEAIVTE